MKTADEIRQLFRSVEFGVDPDTDEKVFKDVLRARQETIENAPALPERWRIIMKSRKAQFTATAVVVLAVYLCLQVPKGIVAPVYALQETIEASNSIRYLHVKEFRTVGDQRWDEESWIEFDEQGKPRRFRYETNRVSTGGEIGPVTIVSDGDGSYTWLPKLNLGFKRSGESVIGSSLAQWEVSDAAPKLVFEKLQKQARAGEIVLDVNEPDQKSEPIVLVVTYPADSRSGNWKKVLYIDQATRLVKKEEKFEKRDGQYQHERTTEFFDYNEQIGPNMFSLKGELPETVFMIDQSDKEVGLAQGDMTDQEIVEEVALQVLNAAKAGDFNKVGQLYLGVPGFLIEKLSGGGGGSESKIISVGPVRPDSDPDSNILVCPCQALGEVGGQEYEFDMKIHVRPVSGQPGRWMICGTTSHVKPAPGPPRPLEMVLIPPGTFMMGSPNDEQDRDTDEGPQHQVTLKKSFYTGKYPVTVGQYVKFLEATGDESGVDWNDHDCPLLRSDGRYTLREGRSWNQPMVEISWYGAAIYCNYLSEKEGLQSVYNPDRWEVDWNANGYRLPTEAEWEYACRAGTQTMFYWGDDPRNKGGQENPNAFGLYDISGNACEWCQDWYGRYGDSSQTDPIGPGSGSHRVVRGGYQGDRYSRSARRRKNSPDEQHASIAFRIMRLDVPKPLEMVSIPPGTFMTGSPSDEQDRDSDEGPQHQVTLTKGFYMGKYEVTVGQYALFLEAKGKESGVNWDDNGCPLSRTDGAYTLRESRSWNEPMAEVSWYGAAMYCNYLSEKEGLQTVYDPDTWEVDWKANGYRLPTEAEWEYACRAGTQTRFYWGDDPDYLEINEYCWSDGEGYKEVGQKRPNAFGLYDMSGNVYEWCQDWHGNYGEGNQTDPIGPSSGSNRVIRGGFRDEGAQYCRSANRSGHSPDTTRSSMGFRVLKSNP